MRQFTFFAVACALMFAISARADEVLDLDSTAGVTPVGDLIPGNSYTQNFTAFVGSGIGFNTVKVQMVSSDTLEANSFSLLTDTSVITPPNVPAVWTQTTDTPLLAIATGAPGAIGSPGSSTSLNFDLTFNTRPGSPPPDYSLANPLIFELKMLRGDGVRGDFIETYTGGLHGWSSVSVVPLPPAAWMGVALMGGMVVWQVRRKTNAFSLIA